jgi:hypothetical protein
VEDRPIPDLLADYRETLVRWGEESERLGESGTAGRANKLFDRSHAQFKILRGSQEGRDGITALMNDSNPYVASTAAVHSLLWAPELAAAALETFEASETTPWQVQISANYALKEWRAGTLNLDW